MTLLEILQDSFNKLYDTLSQPDVSSQTFAYHQPVDSYEYNHHNKPHIILPRLRLTLPCPQHDTHITQSIAQVLESKIANSQTWLAVYNLIDNRDDCIAKMQKFIFKDPECSDNDNIYMNYVLNHLLKYGHHLSVLSITNGRFVGNTFSAVIKYVKESSSLRRLDLSYNGLDDKDILALLDAITPLSNIVEINVLGNPIGIAGGLALCRATRDYPNIEFQFIPASDLTKATAQELDQFCEGLGYLSHITTLILKCDTMNDTIVQTFMKSLKNCTELSTLALSFNHNISQTNTQQLGTVLSVLKNIKVLYLSGMTLEEDDSIQKIFSGIYDLAELKELHLEHHNIKHIADFMHALCQLHFHCGDIQVLNIAANKLSKEHIPELAKSFRRMNLTNFYWGMSPRGIKYIDYILNTGKDHHHNIGPYYHEHNEGLDDTSVDQLNDAFADSERPIKYTGMFDHWSVDSK